MPTRLCGAAVLSAALGAACAPPYQVTIDRHIDAALDVSPFKRVFVAGFVAAGSREIDADVETVRVLRSQLRSSSRLGVIDADPLALPDPDVASDVAYWQRIGEELQQPLIVTGTAIFTPVARTRSALQVAELSPSASIRQRDVPTRVYLQESGYRLRLTVVFIDGRTGVTMRRDTLQEEILYRAGENVQPLSGYFDLMDRILPSVLAIVTDYHDEGTRVLLK